MLLEQKLQQQFQNTTEQDNRTILFLFGPNLPSAQSDIQKLRLKGFHVVVADFSDKPFSASELGSITSNIGKLNYPLVVVDHTHGGVDKHGDHFSGVYTKKHKEKGIIKTSKIFDSISNSYNGKIEVIAASCRGGELVSDLDDKTRKKCNILNISSGYEDGAQMNFSSLMANLEYYSPDSFSAFKTYLLKVQLLGRTESQLFIGDTDQIYDSNKALRDLYRSKEKDPKGFEASISRAKEKALKDGMPEDVFDELANTIKTTDSFEKLESSYGILNKLYFIAIESLDSPNSNLLAQTKTRELFETASNSNKTPSELNTALEEAFAAGSEIEFSKTDHGFFGKSYHTDFVGVIFEKGDLRTLEILRNHGIDPIKSLKDTGQLEGVLTEIAKKRKYDLLEYLLAENPELAKTDDLINAVLTLKYEERDKTDVIKNNQEEAIKLLKKYDIPLFPYYDETGNYHPANNEILIRALESKNPELLEFVDERIKSQNDGSGIDFIIHRQEELFSTSKEPYGQSLVSYAVRNGNMDMLKYLESHGIDYDNYKRNPLGNSLLVEAITEGHSETADHLTQKGVRLLSKNNKQSDEVNRSARGDVTEIFKEVYTKIGNEHYIEVAEIIEQTRKHILGSNDKGLLTDFYDNIEKLSSSLDKKDKRKLKSAGLDVNEVLRETESSYDHFDIKKAGKNLKANDLNNYDNVNDIIKKASIDKNGLTEDDIKEILELSFKLKGCQVRKIDDCTIKVDNFQFGNLKKETTYNIPDR